MDSILEVSNEEEHCIGYLLLETLHDQVHITYMHTVVIWV